ncbi:hypothetical protein K2173_015159 [Erythroxylum novogranatense]|uniref:Uncharacterized protein n=1 Tax=Erythroxylum novogranatense TaxID=1862640 RepID=A0AAV8T145_9ROSI|nr:hypothetical protein K2173_015159 [Erythroxylum novogranatense]
MSSFLHSSSLLPSSNSDLMPLKSNARKLSTVPLCIRATSSGSSSAENASSQSTKLVTFLGKGGSGKTTCAVFAAQHYAMAGLRTCLVIQTQDPSANYLLNCKIGTSPSECRENLSAVRLETTKMLLEPLNRLKQADKRLKITQGVLEGVVGEELGVLPAMDSIFAALEIGKLAGFLASKTQENNNKDKFDIIVYDGISSDETLRMIGAASKARLYLRYIRNLAEKTDLGRLVTPSLLRLVDEAMNLTGAKAPLNGKLSAELWEILDKKLEQGSLAFLEQHKFGCYVVMDPNNITSVNSALRYWGRTIQSGAHVSGAMAVHSPHLNPESMEEVKNKFSPLPFASVPHLLNNNPIDWDLIMLNAFNKDAREVLYLPTTNSGSVLSPVKFDTMKKSITLFMPGFEKSEIKLYQYRGGSELLVEAGDQRRVICLPVKIQGKVASAKFIDRSLVITVR